MKVCIATPHSVGTTETFIQVLIDQLPADVLHLARTPSGYQVNGLPITGHANGAVPRSYDRLLNVLPRFVEFRLRRKWLQEHSELHRVRDYLKSAGVEMILASYGPAGVDMLPIATELDIPMVTHFHGYDASRHSTIEEFRSGYSRLFQQATSIISVSQRMRNDLLELGCPKDKLKLVYYGAHPNFFSIEPNHGSNHLLMVGRLTEKKAPHLTILAFSRVAADHPEARLRIVGDGELRSVCEDVVMATRLTDRVDFLGACPRETVVEEMSRCRAFVQHSAEGPSGDREGTPVAVLEAGAAALPVISTNHAGIPDVVLHEETGLLGDERDVDAMASAMHRILSDAGLAAEMGRKARQRIADNFSMDTYIGNVHQVLVDAIAKSKTTSGI